MLSHDGVRLELLDCRHEADLVQACQDGNLWELLYTIAPSPDKVHEYIATAHAMTDRVAFAVIDETTGHAIGSTSYHDILPHCLRLEIGYTWYAKSYWRTRVNTACKFLLMRYAFEVLSYQTVALRTSSLNARSQAAIERLGAKKDGVIRNQRTTQDGIICDTVMYSITADEWPNVKHNLQQKMQQHQGQHD